MGEGAKRNGESEKGKEKRKEMVENPLLRLGGASKVRKAEKRESEKEGSAGGLARAREGERGPAWRCHWPISRHARSGKTCLATTHGGWDAETARSRQHAVSRYRGTPAITGAVFDFSLDMDLAFESRYSCTGKRVQE
ncbi:hypothetical protein DPV78_011311 [Talaromyces pinophilus]|nr:hypothetical protein DPV78_011311 [Talaromyces pinophilus]